ncbi:hypothetical protein PoB_006796600 [Plakobranchus ocellatus]|uniref:Uncharacterized protein n=1 Tax=Plakobranchus ocellatus TaxID=259542 RepID=A0AAV4DC00_9GAST|nr:hypothetical protein PoB_006796600 [Plakobranchus ocellatus]
MQKDKEVGRKEGGGWGTLTEPDRSRWTRIVTNRSRGTNLYVRRANGEKTRHTDREKEKFRKGNRHMEAREHRPPSPVTPSKPKTQASLPVRKPKRKTR